MKDQLIGNLIMTPEQSRIKELEDRIAELENAHRFVGIFYLLRGIHRVSQWARIYKGEPIEAGLNYAMLQLHKLAEEIKRAPITAAEFEMASDWSKKSKQ